MIESKTAWFVCSFKLILTTQHFRNVDVGEWRTEKGRGKAAKRDVFEDKVETTINSKTKQPCSVGVANMSDNSKLR